MLINRSTDYAVRALKYLAEKNKEASAAELTKELSLPRPFMRKLMQTLGKGGFVKSRKGRSGGFSLIKRPEDIGLMELIKLFQGPVCLNDCIFMNKTCHNWKKCFLRKKLGEIEEYAFLVLARITLKDIVEGGRQYGETENN